MSPAIRSRFEHSTACTDASCSARRTGTVAQWSQLFFWKRFWEAVGLFQWTGQWVGGNTAPTAEDRSQYTVVRLEGRNFAYRLWHRGSIGSVSTLHKLQLGPLPSSLSAELASLQRAIEHCISLVFITEAVDVLRKLKQFWMQSCPSAMGRVMRQCG